MPQEFSADLSKTCYTSVPFACDFQNNLCPVKATLHKALNVFSSTSWGCPWSKLCFGVNAWEAERETDYFLQLTSIFPLVLRAIKQKSNWKMGAEDSAVYVLVRAGCPFSSLPLYSVVNVFGSKMEDFCLTETGRLTAGGHHWAKGPWPWMGYLWLALGDQLPLLRRLIHPWAMTW